jgi:hypothetical protein
VWLQALTLGPEVFRFRSATTPGGRVIAVLKDAVYIESLEGYVVCIVRGEGIDGPLGMRVSDFEALLSSPQVRVGVEVGVSLHALNIGGTARILWGYAEEWSPPLPHTIGTLKGRQTALGRVKLRLEQARERWQSPVEERTREALNAFRRAVGDGQFGPAADAICSLLGLGEGLTPEGDDIVMGALAAMVWWEGAGKLDARNVRLLVEVVRAFAARTTNKISSRMLWYAGEGLIYGPAMALGEALMAGEPDDTLDPLHRLLSVGNTTGRSVAAGVVAAMMLVTPPWSD